MNSSEYFVKLFPQGKTVLLDKGSTIYASHDKIDMLYLLLDGTVNYYIELDYPKKSVLVAKNGNSPTIIGWAGLHEPGRSMTTVKVSSKQATLFKIPLDTVRDIIDTNGKLNIHDFINRCAYSQLLLAIEKQAESSSGYTPDTVDGFDRYALSSEGTQHEILALMRRSPFLEFFSEGQLKKLAKSAVRKDFVEGESIYRQGELTEGLYILVQGEVIIGRRTDKAPITLRSISTPGFVLGWSSLLEMEDICSAGTTHETTVLLISKESINNLRLNDPGFDIALGNRLLWIIGNQLNASYIRQVQQRLNHDQLAIHNLINTNRSKLKISSSLHQVPHLLNDRDTLELAYETLHNLNNSGDTHERHIASLALDLLKNSKKEHKFLTGLKKVYEIVAEAQDDIPATEIRRSCSKAVKDLFAEVRYHVEGWEYLPETPGNIFIYNHLLNDPYYTLPNNFQITLDSHFISAMLLDEKYQDPGLRIVRIGMGAEYGHQNYYQRLGYINVYTKDSPESTPAEKQLSRDVFYKEAEQCLKANKNLIISPEGISYPTEESPGQFKIGAFGLAAKTRPEPFIVPVVLLYFDRRVVDNLFYCRILKPFKMSDHVDPTDRDGLKKFVGSYQKKFAKEVKKSIEMAEAFTNNQ